MFKASTGAVSVTSLDRLGRFVFLTAAAGLLAACEPGTSPFGGSSKPATTEAAPRAQTSTRLVERDVEAPQVYQVSDTALWDGRPSLGGVWVAAPDVKDPERVIMRNPANGKFVIGALFRREQDNPGPRLQISSDAADALGLLAGAPGKISVTALRREESADTPPAVPILDTAEPLPAATASAIDGGGVSTQPLAAPGAKAGAAPAAIATAATGALNAAAPAARPAAAPVAAAKPPAPAAATASAAAAGGGTGRPIQIGFFSVEANATRASQSLTKAGIASSVRKESSNGKDYWSVTARGDAAMLKKIKSAGFSDAYLLK